MRSGLQEVTGILDVLQTWNWDVVIPNVPGSNGDTRTLTYKCVSSAIPGSSVEQVKLENKGIQLNFAGRRLWTQTWDATFVESRDSSTRGMMIGWLEMMRSWENNSGSYKSQYAKTVELTLYDDLPQASREIQLINAFPLSMGDVTLDNAAGIIQYSVSFSYDFTKEK